MCQRACGSNVAHGRWCTLRSRAGDRSLIVRQHRRGRQPCGSDCECRRNEIREGWGSERLLDAFLSFGTNADGFANNFVAVESSVTCCFRVRGLMECAPNDTGIVCWCPSASKFVKITSTNSAMRDLDINIVLLPLLGLVLLPLHFALGRLGVFSYPPNKLGIVTHCSS